MKCLLMLSMLLLSTISYSQQVERVNPIYGNDEQANRMISYISENLKLIIPKERNLTDVNGMMRCKITIDPYGKIADIKILNSLQLWLDIVIIEALKSIPASPTWKSSTAHELKKALVFSFGNFKGPKAIYGYDKEMVDNRMEASINEQREKQIKQMSTHWQAWNEKSKSDLKMDMPLSPDRNKMPVDPMIKDKPITPPSNLPKVNISLE